MRMSLEYLQPVIMVLKSHLWPLHLHSALTLHYISSRQQEYLPRVRTSLRDPPIPPLDAEHRREFVGLKPGQPSVVTVSFRPYKEPYDYNKMKGGGTERCKMLFPIGMQFLTVGEVGIQGYMLGDMDDVVGEEGKSVEWTSAGDLVETVPEEKCRFRVTVRPCRQMQAPCMLHASVLLYAQNRLSVAMSEAWSPLKQPSGRFSCERHEQRCSSYSLDTLRYSPLSLFALIERLYG